MTTQWNPYRRRVLKAAALGGLAAPLFFDGAAWAAGSRRRTAPRGREVVFGFNLPMTGACSAEGSDQMRALTLATRHLNGEGDGGLLSTFSSGALAGAGVLGKEIRFAVGDTRSCPHAGRRSARNLVAQDGAIMVTGGSSSAVAIAVQAHCHEAGVLCMVGNAQANDITGKEKRRNGFRYASNTHIAAAALAPVLSRRYGEGRRAYHLTASCIWGRSMQASLVAATEAEGWQTVGSVEVPPGQGSSSAALVSTLPRAADVIFLNLFGDDLVAALEQAQRLELRERQQGGRQVEIVAPILSGRESDLLGSAVTGILGTADWHWSLADAGSRRFAESFAAEYGRLPSQSAHCCYVQTLLYADAVERAGSFDPRAVVDALEDFRFSGLGGGTAEYRGSDHQCFKNVLIVEGAPSVQGQGSSTAVIEVIPASRNVYRADHPVFAGGELGACNVGA